MRGRSSHVSPDRLLAMAIAVRPDEASDEPARRHVAACDRCAAELGRLTGEADALREAAFAEADAVFDDAMRDAQRGRILDRLASLGQVARVIRFPGRAREAAMPVSSGRARWISVAAAAGLIIGLVAGQLLHFVPWGGPARRDATLTLQAPSRPAGSGITPVAATSALSDEQFLDEIEAAVQLRRAHSLRALDALTPTAGDLLDLPPRPR